MAWIPGVHDTPEGKQHLEERIKGEVESWNQHCEERILLQIEGREENGDWS